MSDAAVPFARNDDGSGLRVLRLTPFFHHPDAGEWPAEFDSLGGMQVQTWRQSMWLAEGGVSQHVLTIGFPALPRRRSLHERLCVERALIPMPAIRSEISGLWGLTTGWAIACLWRLPSLRRDRFDLIHAHFDGQIPAMIVAMLAPRLLRHPIVITVHCSRLASYRPVSIADRLQHAVARWCEARALAGAQAVIALTPATAGVLRSGSTPPRVHVLPDVLDPEVFRPTPDADVAAFRERHGFDRPVIGYVGRIAAEKGWRHLIPLAQALRRDGVGVLIVGDGPQRERLEQAISEYDLDGWITVTGFIANDAVPAAIAACRLVVMPSSHEEFGGVSIEAFAVGVPVVAFAVGGLRQTIGEFDPGLLVPPGDTDALILRVREVLARGPTEALAPERLRAYVLERFTPRAVLGRLLEIYKMTIRQSAPDEGSVHRSSKPSPAVEDAQHAS